MGIPFECWTTSETNHHYRAYQAANHKVQHQHESLQKQLDGEACALHPGSGQCDHATPPDCLVIGAPCNPFSRANSKRFIENAVQTHKLSSLTLSDVSACLHKWRPFLAIMETTDGFMLPLDTETDITPLKLRLESKEQNGFYREGIALL